MRQTIRTYEVILSSMDVSDSFLQVLQAQVVEAKLRSSSFAILRNLLGQPLGAKCWRWYCRDYLTTQLNFQWCKEQPCLARCVEDAFAMYSFCTLMTSCLQEMLNSGATSFFPTMSKKFKVSCSVLADEGSSILFLRRKVVRLKDGLLLVPGTAVTKVTSLFEKRFGVARGQQTPSDSSIRQDDSSPVLCPGDATAFRSVVGLLLYLALATLDIMLAEGIFSSYVTTNPLCLQRMRKLIGHLLESQW